MESKRNEPLKPGPLNVKSIKQSGEPEPLNVKVSSRARKERVAKRQWYWKSPEPGLLGGRDRLRYGEPKYTLKRHRKSTTDKVTQRYVVHVHVPVAT